jgi:pimeloyl-ACP methyl ester carboxylesterase
MTAFTPGSAAGLRYHEAGSGDPLITVGAALSPGLDLLAGGFRVIAADLPSGDPSGLAAAVDGLAGALGLGAYHLLGASAGAAAALHAALLFPGRLRSLILAAPAGYDESAAARMAACEVRTLVLLGTRDAVLPAGTGRVYRRLLPNCTLQYVYDAGHAIADDRPAAFADVTGDFLRRGLHFLIPDQDTLINP